MRKHMLSAILIAFSATAALAAQPTKPSEDSLSGKAMHDLPGNNGGGATSKPNAQPDEQSLSGKVMHEHPGATGTGSTTTPTSKPNEQSLSGKAMRDQPGNN
jgi:hypothetical protein